MGRIGVSVGVLLWASVVAAQPEQVCLLEERNAGQGLSLAVDDRGGLHMAYVVKLSGDLRYLSVPPDGAPSSEVVAPRISRLAIDEVRHPDLILVDGQPSACWYSAATGEVLFAQRADGGWQTEVLEDAMGSQDGCALVQAGDRVWAFYRTAAGLTAASRAAGGGWQAEVVAMAPAGAQPHAVATADGALVVAHNDGAGQLFVTRRPRGGAWNTQAVPGFGLAWGAEPTAVDVGEGEVWVVHGAVAGDSDAGVALTTPQDAGWTTDVVIEDAYGGSLAAAWLNGGLAIAARQLRRSALFGAADGLTLFEDFEPTPLGVHGSADQRHRYQYVELAPDPFGQPVVAVYDDRAPFRDEPDGGYVCWYLPADRDNDRIPDRAEPEIGTDPDNPDSDGDGRDDGDEWLDDLTDPTGDGPRPGLDMGAPEADQGAPEPDQGAPELDQGAPELDQGAPEPDQGELEPDGGPGEDDMGAVVQDQGGLESDLAVPALDQGAGGQGGQGGAGGQGGQGGVGGQGGQGGVGGAGPGGAGGADQGGAGGARDAGVAGDLGAPPATQPGEGCQSAGGGPALPWALLLGLGALRRRRHA